MNKKTAGLMKFISGIMFCLAAVILVFFENDIPIPIKISLLIVGIVLIAKSNFRLLK